MTSRFARPAEPSGGPASLVRLGVGLGLLYGLLEAAEFMLLGLVPGALAWRTGNSAEVLWFAPLFYGAVFGVLGLLVALVGRAARVRPPGRVLLVLCVALGGFLGASLQGQVFNTLASLVLAVAFATIAFRVDRRWHDVLQTAARRSVLPVLGLVGLLAAGITLSRRWSERRALAALPANPGATNVLLIVLDTQRADRMATYGYRRPTTPRLDSLARSGTVFLNATAPSSWTLPTHASLFTGRMLHEHRAGVMQRPYLDRRLPTLAEVLRERGYATGGFVANGFWVGRQTGLDRGFVRYEDFYGSLGDAVARTVLGRRLSYEVFPRFSRPDIPGRKRAPRLNQDLLAWLDRIGSRPFFAFVNYLDVHAPLLPPAPYAGRFSGLRAEDYRRGRSVDIGALTAETRLPTPDVLQQMGDAYDESLLSLDAAIGDLFAALAGRGLLDRTLVLITSDHGESFGEHGFLFHGHSLYRDQTHVPLLAWLPGRVPAGLRAEWPVGLEQIPTTVLQLANLANSTFSGPGLFDADSARLVPSEVGRRAGIPAGWPSAKGTVASLTTSRWHFIETESGRTELYDLLADPGELRDLSGEAGQAPLVAGFRQALAARLAGSGLSWSSR